MNDPVVVLKKQHREAGQQTGCQTPQPGIEAGEGVDVAYADRRGPRVSALVAKVVGDEEAQEAEIEHELARGGLAKMVELTDEPGFGAAVAIVTAGIKHHVKEEEQELFPDLKRKLGRDDLRDLGDAVVSAIASKARP